MKHTLESSSLFQYVARGLILLAVLGVCVLLYLLHQALKSVSNQTNDTSIVLQNDGMYVPTSTNHHK